MVDRYTPRSPAVVILAALGVSCVEVGAAMWPPISGRAVAFQLRGQTRPRSDLFVAIASIAGVEVAHQIAAAIPAGLGPRGGPK